jgi:TonB-linked SusC/RagA family outer membrane protein
MRKFLSLLSVLVLCSALTYAQTKTITGRVVDAQGQPVPFATVRVKDSKTGVSADADGKFEIKASPTTTLVITGAGIQAKEVLAGSDNNLVVQVSRQSTLDEVVVTALGVRRSRNTLPYAAQQISGDDVNKTVTTNVVDNLSGKVAGLEITSSNAMGGSANVILRGMRSLTQSNQALFVVDGVPYDNTSVTTYNNANSKIPAGTNGGYDFGSAIEDLNPDDIASISVLPGAAASALYGSRGSNGVILITTKKGSARKGVGVTASFGVSAGSFDPSTLPSYQLMYGEGYDATNNGFNVETVPWLNNGNTPITIAATPDDAATGPAFNKSEQVYNWDAFAPDDPNFHKSTAWQPAAHHNPQDYFVTPITATENVIVTGGSDKGTYKFAYTRVDDKGYQPNSMIKKNLFDLLTTYNITNWLTVEAGLNYVNENALNRYLYQYTAGTNPMTDFRQWWPSNVDIKSLKADYFKDRANETWNWQDNNSYQNNVEGNIGTPAYHDNEYWFAYTNPEADSRNRYTGHARVKADLTSYLNFTGGVTEDYYGMLVEQRANIGSQAPSFYQRQNFTFSETNYNAVLNFDKNLGSDFNLKALAGTNVQRDNLSSILSSTNGGLVLPGYWAVNNSVNTPSAPVETEDLKEINSLYGGVTLTWRDMITLDATLRRDQSSTLPAAHNTYYYPGISADFVFSKLLPNADWLSYGKVWGNYAQVGGDAPYYDVYNSYTINTPVHGAADINGTTSLPNQNLLPEKNKSWEAGLEMNFLNNRLGFTADYYHSVQSNEILPINVSTTTGYGTFNVNGGAVENQGVEVRANISPVKTKDFAWDITVNWTKPKNKVLSLYGGQPSYAIATLQNNIQIVAEVGKPYGVIRGSDYTYINGQKVISAQGTYVDSSNALSDIGNIQPSWYGGINNSFTYKNFTLSFLIDVHQGGQLYSLDMDYGSFSGLYPRTAGLNDLGNPVRLDPADGGGVILKGISQVTGKANTVRDWEDLSNGFWTYGSGNGQGAEAQKQFIYSATYVKLREVAFTYSIPSKSLAGLHSVRGIDLSLSGHNLLIMHKDLPYADPEQGQASGNYSMGFQNGAYPTVRTLNFIVKVKF